MMQEKWIASIANNDIEAEEDSKTTDVILPTFYFSVIPKTLASIQPFHGCTAPAATPDALAPKHPKIWGTGGTDRKDCRSSKPVSRSPLQRPCRACVVDSGIILLTQLLLEVQ